MKFYSTITSAIFVSAALALASCGDAPSTDEAITDIEVSAIATSSDNNENVAKVQEIFHSVPSPMDMATMLKESGAKYDVKMLNDVKRVHEYTSARSRALNLGIYGADLSYASIFNQNQESIIYMSCTKKLSDNLGLSKAFDDESIERMETNIDNRDSLLQIISETYYMLDAYLKENDRDHISAMVIAAGWIEGLYLATSVTENAMAADDKLRKRVAEQKISLDNLVMLVDSYNKNGELDDIEEDLAKLDIIFQEVNLNRGQTDLSKNSNGVTVIGGENQVEMSDEALKKITETVREIRTRYVQV